MLAEPERTPYDLNFRLFGFPIRIHPLFWLGAALLGANTLNDGLHYMVIWIGIVFVSILVHELGHAIAYRRFGSPAHIVLLVFGGLAVPYTAVYGRWRRIVVSLAGPCAGFVLCAAVYALKEFVLAGQALPDPVWFLVGNLIFVNLVWGIFNLFPVFPLDGGQVSRELCEGRWRGRGLRICLQISVGVAIAVVVYSGLCAIDAKSGGKLFGGVIPWWLRGTWLTAILFGMLAVQNYQYLQQIGGGGGYYYEGRDDDRPPWK